MEGEHHRQPTLKVGLEPSRKQVLACLDRILQSPPFQGSRRCQELLQYLVTKRLDGELSALKERVIGAELFGRDPAYATSSDAIVRVKANEVRKRLAAYYGESGRDEAVRIELPVGSYVPVFRRLENGAEASNPRPVEPPAKTASRGRNARWWALAALVLALAGLAVFWLIRPAAGASERFWAAFYHSEEPLLICIPARDRWFFDPPVAKALADAASRGAARLDLALQPGNIAVVPDAQMSVQNFRAVIHLVTHFARRRIPTEVRLVSEVSAEAIRRRQVILLGAYHNPWAMDLSAGMRFLFESENEGSLETAWVKDNNAPGKRVWKVPRLWPHQPQAFDYAIISRTVSPVTGQTVVSLAGINGFGTQVAAEFLTGSHYWEEFARLAPAGWEQRNCQIVLETKLVREVPNPPKILAVHVW